MCYLLQTRSDKVTRRRWRHFAEQVHGVHVILIKQSHLRSIVADQLDSLTLKVESKGFQQPLISR